MHLVFEDLVRCDTIQPSILKSEAAPGFGKIWTICTPSPPRPQPEFIGCPSFFQGCVPPPTWSQRLALVLGRMCPSPTTWSQRLPLVLGEGCPPPPTNLKSEAAPGFGKVPCCVWTPRYKLHKLNLCNHVVQPTGINKSSAEPPFLYLCYSVYSTSEFDGFSARKLDSFDGIMKRSHGQ